MTHNDKMQICQTQYITIPSMWFLHVILISLSNKWKSTYYKFDNTSFIIISVSIWVSQTHNNQLFTTANCPLFLRSEKIELNLTIFRLTENLTIGGTLSTIHLTDKQSYKQNNSKNPQKTIQENYSHVHKLNQIHLKPGLRCFMLSGQEIDRNHSTVPGS